MSVKCAEDLCCDTAPRTWRWTRIALAAFLAGNSMTVALAVNLSEVDAAEKLALQSVPLLAALAVTALIGADLFRNTWAAVRTGRVTIESLFVVAAAGAFIASTVSYISGQGAVYFEVTAIVLVIYSLGQELAQYTKSRVLSALAQWDPAAMQCEVLKGEISEYKPVTSVHSGDYVRVHPGSVIPIDGVISEGNALVQQGGITGELTATTRLPGDSVFAGTHVVDATLVIQATAAGADRSVDRVLDAVRQAELQPGSSQARADKIARWFVPAVLVAAVLTFIGHSVVAGVAPALFNAMAVLLVACPCALGFGTPVAVWTAMRRLQMLGLQVKRGDVIERLAAVNLAVFDKTGTLGLPDPQPAVRIEPHWQSGQKEVEELVSAAEAPLNHPFSRVLTLIKSDRGEFRARRIRVEPGSGVAAEVETSTGVARLVRIASEPGTPEVASLSVEIDGERAATIQLQEQKRPYAESVTNYLRGIGIDTVLMTGDRIERTAQFKFGKVHASVTPEKKLALVQELKQQGHRILFTGDGMNDAAAMAASDVSIAAGVELGLSQQVASIVWPAPRFDRLAGAITICRDTDRLVRSNLRFALAYNVIGIAIAAMGLLHPVIAVILMTVSSCVVVLRSLRLLDANEPGVSTDSHAAAS